MATPKDNALLDLLLDGTQQQIQQLFGSSISFEYSQKCGAFTVKTPSEEIYAHKIYDVPNCVKFLGNKYTL